MLTDFFIVPGPETRKKNDMNAHRPALALSPSIAIRDMNDIPSCRTARDRMGLDQDISVSLPSKWFEINCIQLLSTEDINGQTVSWGKVYTGYKLDSLYTICHIIAFQAGCTMPGQITQFLIEFFHFLSICNK